LALDASRAAAGEKVSAESTCGQFTIEVPVVFRLGIEDRRIPAFMIAFACGPKLV